MKNILIAECKQEVSTFNPHHSTYADFAVRRGSAILDYHRTIRNEVGGAVSVLESRTDINLIPTYSAFFITSGGTLAKPDWLRIADEFLSSIREAFANRTIDGIYFCMHGAMASEEELDPEGYLLESTRQIVGSSIPIVVSLDLHGILTNKMLTHADAIVAYHTYPHVDFFETGQRAAKLLLRILDGHTKPVTAKVAIPALVRGDELITETGLFGNCIRTAQRYEVSAPGLSAGMFIGNPFTDVPELQSYSFVVTDDKPDIAEKGALEIANLFWSYHQQMQVPLTPLQDLPRVFARRNATGRKGTVALVDAADATSSGASGDSNAILATLMGSPHVGQTLIPIVDAPAVEKAFLAGVGGEIHTTVGGTLDHKRFEPLLIRGKVRLLSDGVFRSESFGELWLSGNTAVVDVQNFTLVIASRAVNLYDRSFFYAHGQNPANFDAVIVKSPHCQKHMYAAWCDEMVLVDAPGSSSANIPYLGHKRCPRPIFPLDKNINFHPKVEIFTRA